MLTVKRDFSSAILAISLSVLCALPHPAPAAVIDGEQYFEVNDRRESLDRIEAVLAREEVASNLRRLGVEPDAALARAESLSNQELQLLAQNLEEMPAGGSVVGTVGVVFLVLLILELVGVIDIFKKI